MSDTQLPPPARLPAINVGWDDATKQVVIQFDKETFVTWDFIVMVLTGGLKLAEFNLNMARAQGFQQQQAAAAQAAQMKKRLGL